MTASSPSGLTTDQSLERLTSVPFATNKLAFQKRRYFSEDERVFPPFQALWTDFGRSTAMRFKFHARQTSTHS